MKDEYIDIPVQQLHGAFGYLMNCTVTETGMTLDECVEKQIAKKPTMDYPTIASCPICDEVICPHTEYCPDCGQKLDWGNEDE